MRLLQPVCAAAEPFELAFEHLALWPQPRPRLAVALFEATPALLALAQPAREWAQAQGIALDPRPFQAHVTLIRSGRPLPPAPAFKLAPFALRVGRITLMHRGPPGAIRYQRFASHELGCAG